MQNTKKLGLALSVALLLVGTCAFGAAPDNNSAYDGGLVGTASATVDSQWTGTWELIDSMIIIETDSCNVLATFSAVAALDPGDKLYIGFLSGGGDYDAAATDTFTFEHPACSEAGTSLTFSCVWLDSLRAQTDANDTLYVTAAVSGSEHTEEVALSSIVLSVLVEDHDAAE